MFCSPLWLILTRSVRNSIAFSCGCNVTPLSAVMVHTRHFKSKDFMVRSRLVCTWNSSWRTSGVCSKLGPLNATSVLSALKSQDIFIFLFTFICFLLLFFSFWPSIFWRMPFWRFPSCESLRKGQQRCLCRVEEAYCSLVGMVRTPPWAEHLRTSGRYTNFWHVVQGTAIDGKNSLRTHTYFLRLWPMSFYNVVVSRAWLIQAIQSF